MSKSGVEKIEDKKCETDDTNNRLNHIEQPGGFDADDADCTDFCVKIVYLRYLCHPRQTVDRKLLKFPIILSSKKLSLPPICAVLQVYFTLTGSLPKTATILKKY